MRQMAALSALLWIIVPATAAAQDAKTTVENALRALGAAGLNSIVYSGEAAYGNFGQSRTISFGLASTSIRNYTRAIDFTRPALRETGIGVPVAGPRSPQLTGPAAAPRPFELTAPSADGWPEQMEIWVTPWGFLKGALANNATARSRKIEGVTYQVVTWSPAQKAPSGQPYRLIGYINPQQILERVETWIEHPVVGDMHVETFFTDYADFGGGLLAPARITQRRVGMETYVAHHPRGACEPGQPRDPDDARRQRRRHLHRLLPRRSRPRSWPTASIELPADMSRWPSSSRTTSLCSRAGRAKRAGWR